jgi:hypothetical protein
MSAEPGLAAARRPAKPRAPTATVATMATALGVAGGLLAEDRLLRVLDIVPGAATHLFLTVPIGYLATGAALVASARWREWLAPICAVIFGAMLGLTIKLTDPACTSRPIAGRQR